MQYRKDISILGYGCMRFTHSGASIDFDKAEKEIMRAYENGVNYFDTAYIYPGSEVLIGEIFEKNGIREKINIATKLPPYLCVKSSDLNRLFEEECKRLRTDYIDFYLMHMLTDIEGFNKLKKLGFEDWVKEKKESGRIKRIGFSFHGTSEMFIEILNAYDWDFAQIQYNYLDEHTQAGVEGLKAAEAKGIPVIIMEPLRGGKLVTNLPADAVKAMDDSGRKWSPAEWGLRWLWNQSGVTCVLSGMNSLDMVDENCRIASEATENSLTDADFEVYSNVKEAILRTTKVPCTGCRYCMPCPKNVDIPNLFAAWNHMYSEGKHEARMEYFRLVALRKEKSNPSECIGCGKCESHCPQGIDIRKKLKEAEKEVFPWYYKIEAFFMRLMMFAKR